MTCERLGWKFTAADVIVTDVGTVLDLCSDTPSFVLQATTDAVRRYINREINVLHPSLRAGSRGPTMVGFRKALR